MALNFKTLGTRAMTAAVFVAVLMFGILFNYLSFTLLFLIVALWGVYEFYQLSEKLGAKPFKILGLLSTLFFYAINTTFVKGSLMLMPLGFVFLFFIFIAALFSKREQPIQNAVYTIAGFIYAGLPFLLLNRIAYVNINYAGYPFFLRHNPHIILGIILLIWSNDTFAYLVGSMIGKNKLFERISPGKTWEGSIGGGILTLAASYLMYYWFPWMEFRHWLVIAFLIVVFGTIGDLVESMLKRQAGVKDSGKIMPGHGGILDRFDSLLFVSPFIYAYLSLVF